MKLNRRRVLGLAGSTLLASTLSPVFARTKPLRVLMLGGTGFIGPHFVHALTAGGHQVTLFNRGKRDPDAKQGVEQLLGDRNDNRGEEECAEEDYRHRPSTLIGGPSLSTSQYSPSCCVAFRKSPKSTGLRTYEFAPSR